MKDLRALVSNPLQTARPPSWEDFRRFSETHVGRLSGPNVPAPIAILLAPTVAAHTAVFGKFNNATVAQAVQENFAVANDLAMQAFKDAVKRRRPAIEAVYAPDSPEYQQFFPQGMEQYREMNKGNADVLTNQFVEAIDAFAADIPPALQPEFQGLRAAVLSTRTSQLNKIGITDDLSEEAATLRAALEEELYVNIHTIAAHFRGDVEACMVYFDQSMLRDGGGDDNDADDGPDQPA